jgi:hypothetical protein
MNHLIKLTSTPVCAALALCFAGCGESNAEKMAKEKERQRMEMEQQALRDLKKSNEAVSDISKKIGRKVEPMDLGIPTDKKSDSAPAAPPQKQ